MAETSRTDDVWRQLQGFERQGNINAFIAMAVEEFSFLRPVAAEVLGRIGRHLQRAGAFISPDSIVRLRTLPENLLEAFGLKDAVSVLPLSPPSPVVGRICFPAAATAGFVRELEVSCGGYGAISSERAEQLDRVGAAVTRVLENRLGCGIFWDPLQYSFSIQDPWGDEDLKVNGGSMDLSLALALYSRMTGRPVPANLSATARVKRNGKIGPVDGHGLVEKLEALRRERYFIEKVLVADAQEPHPCPGIEAVVVSTLADTLLSVYPDPPELPDFCGAVDVKAETDRIQRQYGEYLLDTCIENATRLKAYLNGEGFGIEPAKRMPALFICHWRLGSCYCHKGDIHRTESHLKQAFQLYRKHSNLVGRDIYLNAKINYAVLLKDVFRFAEAKALHRELEREMNSYRLVDEYKGKNLSSLSQLYLATGAFEQAETLQRKALRLIPKDQRHQNYNYLALCMMRRGSLAHARACLDRSIRLIESVQPEKRRSNREFFHWIDAEWLYRKALSLKREAARIPYLRALHESAASVEMTWYPIALARKFDALGWLLQGDCEKGLEGLERVAAYFEKHPQPMFKLLGAMARAEKALNRLKAREIESSLSDIRAICNSLEGQRDIQRFFGAERKALLALLRHGSKDEVRAGSAENALLSIIRKIPY